MNRSLTAADGGKVLRLPSARHGFQRYCAGQRHQVSRLAVGPQCPLRVERAVAVRTNHEKGDVVTIDFQHPRQTFGNTRNLNPFAPRYTWGLLGNQNDV